MSEVVEQVKAVIKMAEEWALRCQGLSMSETQDFYDGLTQNEELELYHEDHTETYMLDNLRWRFPVDGGFHKYISNKLMKNMDERASVPVGSVPVVRELCNKCGGYGGEQVEDGWLSCYRCCEVGFVHSPLDEYLMDQLYADAYEHNYQRGMKIEQSKRDALASLHIIGQSLDKLFDPPVEEVEDDIPF